MIKLIFQKDKYVNRTNRSKECMLCHYWYFLKKTLNIDQTFVMVADIVQRSTDFKNNAIARIKKNAYRIYFQ